jgi:hypothetical protein
MNIRSVIIPISMKDKIYTKVVDSDNVSSVFNILQSNNLDLIALYRNYNQGYILDAIVNDDIQTSLIINEYFTIPVSFGILSNNLCGNIIVSATNLNGDYIDLDPLIIKKDLINNFKFKERFFNL